MKKTKLIDKSEIYCINWREAQVLQQHIDGYFDDYITINKDDTIVDIGANIGVFGLELSKRYKDINIFSFEPIKNIYDVLKENSILSNNKNFKVYHRGISDENGIQEFNYFPNSPALSSINNEIVESDGYLITALEGSLSNPPKNWWWAHLIPKFLYPHIIKQLLKGSIKVECEIKTLSNQIESISIDKIDLLKIDCEGNELNVIDGIDSTHWSIIKQLVIEVNDIDGRLDYIKKKLTDLGYKYKIIKEDALKNTNLVNIFAKK